MKRWRERAKERERKSDVQSNGSFSKRPQWSELGQVEAKI